jgi:phosphoribosylamine--glycine ligase
MAERIYFLGQDARTHAVAWRMKIGSYVPLEMEFGSGNGGTCRLGINNGIAINNIPAHVEAAKRFNPHLVFVSSEDQLALGAVDEFTAPGFPVFGPNREATKLESSKIFSDKFFKDHNIPRPDSRIYRDAESAKRELSDLPWQKVVKADGLSGGKDVIVTETDDEAKAAIDKLMVEGTPSGAGKEGIVIQERLYGFETSAMAFVDSETGVIVPLAYSADHKNKYNDNHQGFNPKTGGKGAFAPDTRVTPEMQEAIRQNILEKAVAGMRKDGIKFKGVLYAGLMITPDGPKVLEFNVRLGDPEVQALMMIFNGDLYRVMQYIAHSQKGWEDYVSFKSGYGVAVVVEADKVNGLPDEGRPIRGANRLWPGDELQLFHARTKNEGRETAGLGRVLTVAAYGRDLPEALTRAYTPLQLRRISLPGQHYRTDIARSALVYS